MKHRLTEKNNATEILLRYFSPWFVFPDFYLEILKESDPNMVGSLLCLKECLDMLKYAEEYSKDDDSKIFDLEESMERYFNKTMEIEDKCATISKVMKYNAYDFFKYVMNTPNLRHQVKKIDDETISCSFGKHHLAEIDPEQFCDSLKLNIDDIRAFEKIKPNGKYQEIFSRD